MRETFKPQGAGKRILKIYRDNDTGIITVFDAAFTNVALINTEFYLFPWLFADVNQAGQVWRVSILDRDKYNVWEWRAHLLLKDWDTGYGRMGHLGHDVNNFHLLFELVEGIVKTEWKALIKTCP